ncbi:MAG: hypothetical protein HYZ50_21515 [Deltaproteobacteria bacterium]|nr:hypothetical protein [Deltaproteobacteria bacterium]
MEQNEESESPSLSFLAEGDFDPRLKKTIKTLLIQGEDFLVYLDEDDFVEWRGSETHIAGADEVLNRVSHLETLSMSLVGTGHLQPVRRLIGEGVARLFSDKGTDAAFDVLDRAERYLHARSQELARSWYLAAAGCTACGLGILSAVVWIFRNWIAEGCGPECVETVTAMGFGAIGAVGSILWRSSKIEVEAGAGAAIHRLEGAARVLTGWLGTLVVVLAVKANVLLGVVGNSHENRALLLLLALVAGASERLIPSLIQQVEGSVRLREPKLQKGH